MKATEWSQKVSLLAGLPYYGQHRIFGDKSGALIGRRDGYLVAIGLGKTDDKRQNAVRLVLRYGKIDNTSIVEQQLKPAKGDFKDLKADATTAVAVRTYSFAKPKPETVAENVQNLLAALKAVAPPLAEKCEECQRSEPAITLFNGVPGIRQRLDVAAMEYEKLETNFSLGLLYGAGAALIGSAVWGLAAYGVNRIFLWGAVLIGLFVGKAVVKGMGKVTWPGRITIGLLTVASVLFGDIIFYVRSLMKHMSVEFSVALRIVTADFWKIEAKSGIASVIFALIGAGIVILSTKPPTFKARFEPLEKPLAAGAAGGRWAD